MGWLVRSRVPSAHGAKTVEAHILHSLVAQANNTIRPHTLVHPPQVSRNILFGLVQESLWRSHVVYLQLSAPTFC